MTDDKSNAVATALGTVGTVFWCVQLIPQIIRNYIVKDGTGVPASMMFLWAVCGVPFGAYFVIQSATTVLQVQPQLFTFFALIVYGQVLYYPPVSFSLKKCLTIVIVQAILSAGIEVALSIPLRSVYDRGTHWPNIILGVLAGVLLVVGLLPPYKELWSRNGRVVGINFIFLTMDSLGAVFNILSVAFENGSVDILGIILYCLVLVLELGIFASHAVWAIRVKYFGLEYDDELDLRTPVATRKPEDEEKNVETSETTESESVELRTIRGETGAI